MTIEILYSEVCNLYGESGNISLIENTLKKSKIIKTSLLKEPYFVRHKVDLIYLGSMSPNIEKKVIDALMPYKKNIRKMIDNNVIFLLTGNSMEIMGKEIIFNDGEIKKGLDIFKIKTKIDEESRYHSLYLGKFNKINYPIVGYKCQSSSSIIKEPYLFKTMKEASQSKKEGIRVFNFFGTNLLGPILILNPYFTKYIFSLLKYNKKIYCENELINAYEKRLKEYKSDIKL